MSVREETSRRSSADGDRYSIGGRLRALLALIAALDLTVLALSVVLAASLGIFIDASLGAGSVEQDGQGIVLSGVVIVVGWMLVLAAQGGYDVRNFGSGPEEFRVVSLASVVTAGLVGLTCYLVQLPLSRGFVASAFFVGTPLLLVERYVVRKSVHSARLEGRLLHRVVAVGGASGISEVVDALRRNRQVGYEVVGACLPGGIVVEPERFPVPILGAVADTRRVCDEVGADTVLVARGGFATAQELRRIAWDLEGTDIDLVVVPSVTDVAGPRIHMRPVAGLPLLHVEQPQAGKAGGLSKRLFDIVLAGSALVVVSPLLLVVGMVIRVQDGAPVIFRQRRVGRAGVPFGMVKFRSMSLDAERRLQDLVTLNESDGLLFKMKDDPRITRIGRILRRYSLDELPQLVNVVRGEMSLVGPRPPLPSEVERYADDVHRRLLVRPGLTGLWQVSGRSGLSWDESVRLDLYYVDNWSMMADLIILTKTARAVLGKTGAY